MGRIEARAAWGILFIAVGLLFLLQSVGLIPVGIGLVWASILALGGLAFLLVFLNDHDRNWWAIIPSFTLLGLAGPIVLAEVSPRAGAPWGGALFLGAIGLSFLVIFLDNRSQWWAIIPAGTLLTLAAVAGLSIAAPGSAAWGGPLFLGAIGLTFCGVYTYNRAYWWAVIPAGTMLTLAAVAGLGIVSRGAEAGGVLFVGLGLTFLALYYLPTARPGQTRWAMIPALVLLAMGVLVYSAATNVISYLLPLVLIVAGLWVLLRGGRRPTQ